LRPRVNTEKHYHQDSLFAVAAGAITPRRIMEATAAPDGTSQEIRVGAVVTAVYVEMWLTGDDTVQGSAILALEKISTSQTNMSAANIAALHLYANKKNVFHVFMGLMPPNTQNPVAAVRGWFKIPKSKQRFGLGDKLVLNIFGQSDGLAGCGFYTYKEQY